MPLGPIDFSKAKQQAYPVIPVAQGETRDVEVTSKSWEAEPNKNGGGIHALAKYSVTWEFETGPRTFDLRVIWPITAEGGLWRTKRDLLKLGADPADFEAGDPPGSAVDIEAILNSLFAQPHKAIMRVSEETYTPPGYVPGDESTPQPRQTNSVKAIKSPSADW